MGPHVLDVGVVSGGSGGDVRHRVPPIFLHSKPHVLLYGVVSGIRWVVPYTYRKILGMLLRLMILCGKMVLQARGTVPVPPGDHGNELHVYAHCSPGQDGALHLLLYIYYIYWIF